MIATTTANRPHVGDKRTTTQTSNLGHSPISSKRQRTIETYDNDQPIQRPAEKTIKFP